MKLDSVSNSEAKSLIIAFILGTALIIGGDPTAKEDVWISIILAVAMSIPIVYIYGKLNQMFPNNSFIQILTKTYGKFIGKIFIVFYIIYFFWLGTINLRNSTEYIQVVSFPETPQYVTGILIGLLSIYAMTAGLSVMSKWTKIVIPLIALMIISTFILGFSQYKLDYIKPVLLNGWKPVMDSSFSYLAFPFAETVVFLCLLGNMKDKKNIPKIYIESVLMGGVLLLIACIRNILLLGFPNFTNIYFRSHYATSIIRITTFIQRIEIIVSINLVLTGISKTAICLYAASVSMRELFKVNNIKLVIVIVTFLAVIISPILHTSTMGILELRQTYKYIVIPFQLIIPILTFGIVKFKTQKSN